MAETIHLWPTPTKNQGQQGTEKKTSYEYKNQNIQSEEHATLQYLNT
jgi:hypothetical protein